VCPPGSRPWRVRRRMSVGGTKLWATGGRNPGRSGTRRGWYHGSFVRKGFCWRCSCAPRVRSWLGRWRRGGTDYRGGSGSSVGRGVSRVQHILVGQFGDRRGGPGPGRRCCGGAGGAAGGGGGPVVRCGEGQGAGAGRVRRLAGGRGPVVRGPGGAPGRGVRQAAGPQGDRASQEGGQEDRQDGGQGGQGRPATRPPGPPRRRPGTWPSTARSSPRSAWPRPASC
jgi:hypothetical protein